MQNLFVKLSDGNSGDLIETQVLKIKINPEQIREILLNAIKTGENAFHKQSFDKILSISTGLNPELEVKIDYVAGSYNLNKGNINING